MLFDVVWRMLRERINVHGHFARGGTLRCRAQAHGKGKGGKQRNTAIDLAVGAINTDRHLMPKFKFVGARAYGRAEIPPSG